MSTTYILYNNLDEKTASLFDDWHVPISDDKNGGFLTMEMFLIEKMPESKEEEFEILDRLYKQALTQNGEIARILRGEDGLSTDGFSVRSWCEKEPSMPENQHHFKYYYEWKLEQKKAYSKQYEKDYSQYHEIKAALDASSRIMLEVEPPMISRNYQELGRKILMVDKLPGAKTNKDK